ncbi:hypothetical protein ACIRU3_11455 [Streptomyces sp. NPDC101151]|uniref:hypothetical protein n=1 Tax=Streptomyces sp. NPDC101151 TaxID=3366115 RepID=UPI003819FB8F
MTPWLRLTLRLVRLLLVLAAAVPVCGTATAYGAEAAPPDSPMPSARPTASPSPAARATVSPAARVSASPAEPSRAGSRAGEGRMRPGRPDGPPAEEEGDDTPTVTGVPGTGDPEDGYPEEPETADSPAGARSASASPAEAGLDPARPPQQPPPRNAVHQGGAPTEPTLQILPLGTGLVLIGLGLGLAFVGLRVRRG